MATVPGQLRKLFRRTMCSPAENTCLPGRKGVQCLYQSERYIVENQYGVYLFYGENRFERDVHMSKKGLYRQFQTSLLSMLVVLLLAIFGCYWITIHQENRQTQDKVETAMHETTKRLNTETQRIIGVGTALSNSKDIYRFMAGDRETRLELRDSIRFLLTSCLNTNDSISYAYLVAHDQSHMTAYPDVHQDVNAQTANAIYLKYFTQSQQIGSPFRGAKCLPYIRYNGQLYYAVMTPVYPSPSQTSDTEYLGALIFLCAADQLEASFFGEDDVNILVSCGEEVLVCSDEGMLQRWQDSQREEMHAQQVQNIAWTVWARNGENGNRTASYRTIGILYALCATAVFSILMLILYRKIVDPIRELEKQAIAVSTGDATAITCRSGLTELDSLGQSLNRMLDAQRTMSDEVLRLKTDTYESRILFLQSQINPHFLYNIFEMLRGMASAGMLAELREAASCSAAIYRYCCRSNPEVSLREEFECIRQYARLIGLCYRDAYQCVLEQESGVENVTVPRMLLQPLVENAVLHGFIDNRRKAGVVFIRARNLDGQLELSVSDDGGGLTREQMELLNEKHFQLGGQKEKPIGLNNVLRRLYLIYENAVSVRFEKSEHGGLTIRILFP